ncbi:glycosyltransferase family 4 protein [Sphingobium sufflavum]|uniref:glycosyltransferase family 4 protein n=1 Tax=Sphingobium sufflavum TaxID=1129547 RepID=UPI001F474886|nr:glycosyltransferase family 1 protein [Sphingobium sufflavum]MCE7796832.1 glycosyltransferase family 4 protein [Sphingobium sufflavum]
MPSPESSPVLLDVSRLVWRAWAGRLPTGIDRVMLAYVARYRDRARAVVHGKNYSRILPGRLSRLLFDILLASGRQRRRAQISAILTASFYTPVARGTAGQPYLNVGHTGLHRPNHGRWVARTGVRPVYLVHDLIPITHPQYCREGEDEKHGLRVETLLRCGAGVIANSACTLASLRQFAGTHGLAMPAHSVVAPLGLEPLWLAPPDHAADRLHIDDDGRPYFLTLGTIEGRKNHILLLKVWRDLAAALGERCPRLVIVGQRGWQCGEATALLDNSPVLRPHVTELADCGDDALLSLMAGARALLFPSFAEGYGLPLIEALAVGTPVIASRLDVFREIAGDIVTYLDPHDMLAWYGAVRDYMEPASREHHAQLERMQAAAYHPPSWADHFARVDGLLEAVAA